MSNLLTEYNELVDYLIQCLGDYEAGHPSIGDDVYDILLTHAYRWEVNNPTLIRKDSPTKSVGADLPISADSVPHVSRMWSLGNVYSLDQLEKFLRKTGCTEFSVECKYDGLAVELVYLKGKLISASTRGNGITGKDIYANVLKIPSVPKEIDEPNLLVIHGEVVLKKEVFHHINDEAKRNNLKQFDSIRSVASGILRSGNSFTGVLSFKAYEPSGPEDQYSARMERLKELGFVCTYQEPLIALENVADRILQLGELRELYPYPLDGAVIKVNSYADRQRLGYGTKAPKYSIAYKFAPSTGVTVVEDILFKVSGQGLLVPLVKLVPVKIDGFMVSGATLHNLSVMSLLDVRIGDKVEVSRVADVSNQITRVLVAERAVDITPVEIPTHCPCCQTELVLVPARKSALVCPNTHGCKEQVVARLKSYISPAGVSVPLSVPALERLIETGKVNQIADLYTLTPEVLVTYGGLSEKLASSVYRALMDAKKRPFKTHVAVLGIPTVSHATAQELGKRFASFETFMTHFTTVDKDDKAEMSASEAAIMEWCNQFDNRLMLKLLAKFLDK